MNDFELKNSATNKYQNLPKQILNPQIASKKYLYSYYEASEKIADMVDSHWVIEWDLNEEEPYDIEIITSPFVALVLSGFGAFVSGVRTKKYNYQIRGKGIMFGTLFRPGGFYSYFNNSVKDITNKDVSATSIFKEIDNKFCESLISKGSNQRAIESVEEVLIKNHITNNEHIELINRVIDYLTNNDISKVSQVSEEFNLSERRLQEIFQKYVGVGVKWIILRERLQKAMSIIANSKKIPDWTSIAIDLGYSDQSHFINSFRKIIGVTPQKYYLNMSLSGDLLSKVSG